MVKQELVNQIEMLAHGLNELDGFRKVLEDFTSRNISKSQAKAFVDNTPSKFFPSGASVNNLFAEMTINPSNMNARKMTNMFSYVNNSQIRALLGTLSSRGKGIILSLLKAIKEQHIVLSGNPEAVKALAKCAIGVSLIFSKSDRDIVVTSEQFMSELECDADELHLDIDILLHKTKEFVDEMFEDKLIDGYTKWMNGNNWLSLNAIAVVVNSLNPSE